MRKIYLLMAVMGLALAGACSESGQTGPVDNDPVLLSVIPKAGNTGTEAVISGYWFPDKAEEVTVSVNGRDAYVLSSSIDRINVVMPENELGTYSLKVTARGKEVEGLSFRYAEAPEAEKLAVYSYSPSSGIEGDLVTVTGTCFSHVAENNTVTVNGIRAEVVEAIPTRMVIVLPDNPQGQYPVIVKVGDEIAEGPVFTYLKKPVLEILSIEPSAAVAGSEIKLVGNLFSEVPSGNIVTINGVNAEVLSASLTELTVVVPDNPLGSYPVMITVGDNTAEGPEFTYLEKIYTYEVKTISGSAGRSDANVFVDGGPSETKYRTPHGLCFLPDGRMVIGDRGNHAVKVMDVSTYVTETVYPVTGVTNLLNNPWRLRADASGNLFIVSKANKKLVKYDFSTKTGTAVISMGLSDPLDVAFDKDGDMYVLDRGVKSILKYAKGDYASSTVFVALDENPLCMDFDAEGNMIIATASRHFFKVTPAGEASIIAGSGVKGSSDGNAGEPLTAQMGDVWGLAVGNGGEIYFVDGSYHTVRMLKPGSNGYENASVRTIAGSAGSAGKVDGTGTAVKFNTPYDICVSPSGDKLYVTDLMNFLVREITIKD
ncbi:MAG: IPT/TIG domain-containing protein [Candidatus Cryptobacteroides sp.]